jgi:hypothetical protein
VTSAVWSIYKYPLSIEYEQVVAMPAGAELLHVADQLGELCVWARVKLPARRSAQRHLRIVGTGHSAHFVGRYVGWALMGDGLVWHVFDYGEVFV